MKIKIQKRKGVIGKEADFATICDVQTTSQKEICQAIEKEVGIPMIRSMSVLDAFATMVSRNLTAGNTVEIDGIGRIRVSVTVKDNKPSLSRLIILPSKTLKAELDSAIFEIEQD